MRSDPNVIVAGFTEEEVKRLTGITLAQLRYWDRTGFFSPALSSGDDSGLSIGRIYSFRDLVCLQVLNAIRNESRVPLPRLRDVKLQLAHMGEDVWAKTTLYVLNKKVIFDNPLTRQREEVLTGQKILEIPLEVVRAEMSERVRSLRARTANRYGKIEQTKGIVQNQPVVAGTRVQVKSILAFHKAGYGIEDIIKEYPVLTEEDVRAALAYGKAAA